MKVILWTFIVLFSAIIIYQFFYFEKRSEELQRECLGVLQENNFLKRDIKQVIKANSNIYKNTTICLGVKLPVCNTCLSQTLTQLEKISSESNLKSMVLTDSNSYYQLSKQLMFSSIIIPLKRDSAMENIDNALSFFIINGRNIFSIPLPRKKEHEFIKNYISPLFYNIRNDMKE
ncbi:MAG: hypothetical protein JW717_12540 [Marinilabiliaceae bacterium]|nr:hypothetical protein [Marinilabiliaceae bacterium]